MLICLLLVNMADRLWVLILFAFTAILQGILCQNIEITPKYITANVGESVNILCKAYKKIQYCRFSLQNEEPLNLGPKKSGTDFIYYGSGFENGDCGVKLVKVKDKHNGNVSCQIGFEDEVKERSAIMDLIISRTPSSPVIELGQFGKKYFIEGEELKATCRVSNGRPVANVTWYLGDSVIEGSENVVHGQDHLFTIFKNISHVTVASDDNKMLKCVAEHPGLSSNNNRAQQLILVKYKPKDPKYLEHFGLVEGQEGRIAVEVRANPKPSFIWTVGDKVLYEGNSHGRLSVQKSSNKNGTWESVLLIDSLTKEDVAQQYSFTAANDLGESTYTVVISTSPRPKVLEIGTGTIIIIALVVLLLAIFAVTVLYARARGRWCFAGGDAEKEITSHEGMENPAVTHHQSSDFINKNTEPKKEKPKEDTPV